MSTRYRVLKQAIREAVKRKCWCCNGEAEAMYCARCQDCTTKVRACGSTNASLNWPDMSKVRVPIRHSGNYCQCPSCGKHVQERVPHKGDID